MKSVYAAPVLLLILSLAMVPYVLAIPDPTCDLFVWPAGASETGQPIVTTSPADMQIFVVSPQKNCFNVWLLLTVNNETYYYLESIKITNETGDIIAVYYQADFAEPEPDPYDGLYKIPVVSNETETWPPVVYNETYPGCEPDERYEVSSIKSKLGVGSTDPIYYSIQYVFNNVTTVATNFTITVNAPGVSELKVLVLALGCYSAPKYTGHLNIHSAYTQGTLIIIPELATILLTTASLTAYGTYRIKRRK